MNFEKTFGETIKDLRERKKLTLREVAEALEVDLSMLSKIEKNNRRPSRELIEKFAKYFHVKEKDLTISFLGDNIVYQVLDERAYSGQLLKVAEKKLKYLRTIKNS